MNQFLRFATKVAELAGSNLLQSFRKAKPRARGTSKEIKSIQDILADKIIKDAIAREFPRHSFLTEETGLVDKKSQYLWIVDPLDGTGNFANDNPFFAVSISLWQNQKPILGLIEAPALKERFVALRGQGAWHYDFRLEKGVKKLAKVSEIGKLSSSYVIYCEGGKERRGQWSVFFRNSILKSERSENWVWPP